MNKIFEKWWDKGNKCFSIYNYKQEWKSIGKKPKLKLMSNGAKRKRGDKCLDVILILGYIVVNYTDFNLQRTREINELGRW